MKKIDRTEFNNRVSELRFYIRSLKKLETLLEIDRTNEHGQYLRKEIDSLEKKHKSSDLIAILKANAYMVMYNLIEDTIRKIVEYIYLSINEEQLIFSQYNKEYQELIRNYRLNIQSNPSSTTMARYSERLISDILNDENILLEINKFNLSGNANLKAIEKVCREHKIPITINYVKKYKIELDDIKKLRNDLAHGNVSFVNATRNKTIEDTNQCVLDIVHFLKYLMKKAEQLIEKKGYRSVNN